ncbi:hypothetical protein [Marinoscillum furvescens]|uniref:Long-subunit fatty acid transport protein n=1 Tax=Marinoscillum furvescens DSM 4134 TaxID=1122208 RepID=A0A3D9KW59_MARFU|nr:hypothetical protein [Marinoscillum furvescens]RED92206.1 long-subunit fatty acid transport protein [Marinoscillum furvescens DSM 4134]
MSMIKRLSVLVLLIVVVGSARAQSSNGSFYNRFGLGTLSEYGLGAYLSQGNASIAARSASVVNLKNPAALNAIVGPSHVFDIGMTGTVLTQSLQENSGNTMLLGLNNLNFWLKLGKGGGLTFGASPFSDASYDIQDDYRVDELAGDYSVRFVGNGGLSRYYIGYGQRLFEGFDVGVRLALLAGTITRSQYLGDNELLGSSSVTVEESASQAVVDFGLQYTRRVGQRSTLTLGATYRPEVSVTTRTEKELANGQGDSLLLTGDDYFILPEKIGVGVSLQAGGLLVSWDGELERWGANGAHDDYSYTDVWRSAFGIEYAKNQVTERYLDRVKYRFGMGWENHYLRYESAQRPTYFVTAGVGLPVQYGLGGLDLGYTYKNLSSTSGRMVSEVAHQISLNVTIRDRWFQKRVYD